MIQQLREAFPFDTAPAHLIFDRDAIFSVAVVRFVQALGTNPRRIAYRSPWQNPVAERWIGGCRRELLDHVVVLDQRHLVRLVRAYTSYYHDDRCRLGLARIRPADGRSRLGPRNRPRSSPYRASADCNADTSGERPHSADTSRFPLALPWRRTGSEEAQLEACDDALARLARERRHPAPRTALGPRELLARVGAGEWEPRRERYRAAPPKAAD